MKKLSTFSLFCFYLLAGVLTHAQVSKVETNPQYRANEVLLRLTKGIDYS